MLTELRLANFRIFDEEVTVRFRPITVLLGRNGSGKSAIIEFLLMLQQSQEPVRDEFLTPEGDLANLGVFPELRNSGSRKRTLQFELTMARRPLPAGPGPGVDPRAFIDAVLEQVYYGVEGVVPYGGNRGKGSVSYWAAAGTDGETLRRVDFLVEDDFQFGDYPRPPAGLEELPDLAGGGELSEELAAALAEELAERMDEQRGLLLETMENQELVNAVHYAVDARRHLGPRRADLPRVIPATPPPLHSVGRNGQYALRHLQRIAAEKGERYEFLLPYLQGAAGISELEFRALGKGGQISQAWAVNAATGRAAQLADWGRGVSQGLPILVQGAIMPAYTTLMVEQPEAQLHPAAQGEMGRYFADLWRRRQVGSIIETHSDNILSRLRRLVAAGELAPQDISVAYFTSDAANRNMPVVKNLDINRDGSLAAGLPADFFGAD